MKLRTGQGGLASAVDPGLLAIPEIAALFSPEAWEFRGNVGQGSPWMLNPAFSQAAAQALANLLGS